MKVRVLTELKQGCVGLQDFLSFLDEFVSGIIYHNGNV